VSITIQREDPAQPDVRALIAALDALMSGLYPAESNHLLDIETLRGPGIKFFVARYDGVAVGCGAYRLLDLNHGADTAPSNHGADTAPSHGEIKRMFVTPIARGMRLGWRLLQHLETDAHVAGVKRLSLETGIDQPEAIGLYERAGYVESPPFGAYQPDPLSVFMTKAIG
jgi:putative acetyltransferase